MRASKIGLRTACLCYRHRGSRSGWERHLFWLLGDDGGCWAGGASSGPRLPVFAFVLTCNKTGLFELRSRILPFLQNQHA